jgi:hypothetical protein
MKPRCPLRLLVAAAAALLLLLAAGPKSARADTLIIQHPGDHRRYVFEAEPHLVLGLIDPPGYASGTGFGAGFRGAIPILQNGFIPKLNNSVAIGFGVDFVRYGRGDYCRTGQPLSGCDNRVRLSSFNEFYFPVELQWNYYLSRNWSVFGEPGTALYYHVWDGPNRVDWDPVVFFAGGRYHFAERITLTMRIGYPAFSVGCSFLF